MLVEFLRAKWSIQVENDLRQGITREFYEIPIFRCPRPRKMGKLS